MQDSEKTKEQLIADLATARQQIIDLEASEAEHVRVRQATTEREEMFRQVFDNMTEGLAVFRAVDDGQDFVFVAHNHAGQVLTETTREVVSGKSVTEVFPSVEQIGLLDVFRRVYRSGEPEHLPLRIYRDNRITLWTENFVFKLPSGLIVSLYSDTSAQRMADEALRKNEERLRIISDNTYDWEYWRAPDGKFIWVSPACERITGYNPGECTGDTDATIRMIHPEDKHIWTEHIKEMDSQYREHQELEFRIIKATGETVWISHTCKPIYSNEGMFLGRRGCNRDISDRKRGEEAIAASLHEKEVLLREIHHRVKNNLQIISSLLSLQEQSADNADALMILAESRGRVMSMALVHDQLYHSNEFSLIDVRDYLGKLLPRLVSSFKGWRDIGLQVDIPVISLTLDQAIPFGLIINELVTNALKHGFRDRDRGTLRISASMEEDTMTLKIEDDGVGLPKDFSLGTVTSLGLQIVAMLTDQLRGLFSVEPAEGACFRIQFPIHHQTKL